MPKIQFLIEHAAYVEKMMRLSLSVAAKSVYGVAAWLAGVRVAGDPETSTTAIYDVQSLVSSEAEACRNDELDPLSNLQFAGVAADSTIFMVSEQVSYTRVFCRPDIRHLAAPTRPC